MQQFIQHPQLRLSRLQSWIHQKPRTMQKTPPIR